MRLEELIRQDRFAHERERALLNILVTSSWIQSQLTALMGEYGVTPAQYNVLRILRGTDPAKMTCSDIGCRLIDRTPDVTRLLNRLEAAGYIKRNRSTSDRRVVEVCITPSGKELLERMGPEVEAINVRLARHLSESDLTRLNELLEAYRADQID